MKQRELLVSGQRQIDVLIDRPADADGLSPAGPTIVLLPSSQRDSLDFDPLANSLLGHGFGCVLRPQPPGMARSSAPADDLSLDQLAAEVQVVIQRLGGGRALVAGHAFGHFVARVAGLNHPASVRGVAVLAGAARAFPPGLTQALDLAADRQYSPTARLAALRHAFFAPGHDPSAWLDGWYPQWRTVYRNAANRPPKETWWPLGHVPLLDLQAEDDPWRPAHTRDELRAALGPLVTVQCLANASHALPVEQPATVAAALAAWAKTLPT